MKKFSAFLLIIASFSCATLQKTTVDKSIEKTWKQMNASKEATKTLFNNSKYGMFIHWGLYSIPGGVWEGKKMEKWEGLMWLNGCNMLLKFHVLNMRN